MGSDAIMITPQVEIIKDENGELLPESVVVSVMTCAAPMITEGKEGMTEQQYRSMICYRIICMLAVAAHLGYQTMVLGAFGCGAFGNDAKIVSDLFYQVMKEFNFKGMKLEDFFRRIDLKAAQLAAITHSHSLGYMPAAVLAHIISRCITSSEEMTLKEIVREARNTAAKLFDGDRHLKELLEIIDKAIRLSGNNASDLDNIHALGEGWVAEETLGIALYCSLKYHNDFSRAVIAAVNHNGDSDSTGAVTGNIMGALLGYDAIEDKWKKNLELVDIIMEMADDLCHGCLMSEYSSYKDPAWIRKYVSMHRYQHVQTKPVYTFFWKIDEENEEFSNWYHRTFVIDDFEYAFVEQYMMAQKAKLFHDSRWYTQILRATTPAECKRLGKQITPFDPSAWDAVKYEIVKEGNRAKYEQNPDLMEKLLATGNSIMAEASPLDKIWGIGIDAKIAACTDPEKWPGQNLLGKILMELREEFR